MPYGQLKRYNELPKYETKQYSQQVRTNVVNEAIKQYPILKNIDFKFAFTPKQKSIGGIEFWPAGETGTSNYPRPKEIPQGQIGVQIFNDTVRPIDVLGDIASHHMIYTDPVMKNLYGKFINSMTPEQKNKLRMDYEYSIKNHNERRPFEQWAEISRLPGYFRGYTFGQWPDDFNSKVFTKDQIKLFDEVRSYLGITNLPSLQKNNLGQK